MFTTGKKSQIEQLKEESKNFMIQQGILTLGYSIDQLERIQTLLMKKMVDGPDKINDPDEALRSSIAEFQQEQKAFEQEQFNKLMGNMVFNKTTGMVSTGMTPPGGGGESAPAPAPAPDPAPNTSPEGTYYDENKMYSFNRAGELVISGSPSKVRSMDMPYMHYGQKKRTRSKKKSKKKSKKSSKKKRRKSTKSKRKSTKRKSKRKSTKKR